MSDNEQSTNEATVEIPVPEMKKWYTMTIPEIGQMIASNNGLPAMPTDEGGELYFEHLDTATGSPLYYRDNGSDILLVHHADTVQPHGKDITFTLEKVKATGTDIELHKLNAPVHDDRLGLAIAFEILPQLTGYTYDYLIASDEEVGRSTAQFFKKPEDKNWRMIVEFDRRGTDVVLYSYSDKSKDCRWYNTLKDFFTVGTGSFSDICYLTHLGAKGVNVGTGYQNAHAANSYAILEHTAHMVWQYKLFQEHVLENDLWFHHPDDHYAEKKGKLWKPKKKTKTPTTQTGPAKQLPFKANVPAKQDTGTTTTTTIKQKVGPYGIRIDDLRLAVIEVLPADFENRGAGANATSCEYCGADIPEGTGYIALGAHRICDVCFDWQKMVHFPDGVNRNDNAPDTPVEQLSTVQDFLAGKTVIDVSGEPVNEHDVGIVTINNSTGEISVLNMDHILDGINTYHATILAGSCMISNERVPIGDAVLLIDDEGILDMFIEKSTMLDTLGDDKLICVETGKPTKLKDMGLISSTWSSCVSEEGIHKIGGFTEAREVYPTYLSVHTQ